MFPNHGLLDGVIFKHFYRSLIFSNKTIINSLVGGALMYQIFEFAKVLLEKLAIMSHAWETWGDEGTMGATSANVCEE